MSAQGPTADRMLEVVVPADRESELESVLTSNGVAVAWALARSDDVAVWKAVVSSQGVERVLDKLESKFHDTERFRAVLYALEATVPQIEAPEEESGAESGKPPQRVSRAELYEDIAGSSRLTRLYLVQVVLATVVAAVGLSRDSEAIVIAAMVIAPLLGPNIALSLGTLLGDTQLIRTSVRAAGAGVGLAFALAVLMGVALPMDTQTSQVLSRTDVGVVDIVLALASGAAGSLAFTSGVSTALVGVMVAIALLPPTVAAGALIGDGRFAEGLGASLLLAINVVCVNLASVVTFLVMGIRPARWWEAERSKRATRRAMAIWTTLLVLLAGMVVAYVLFVSDHA